MSTDSVQVCCKIHTEFRCCTIQVLHWVLLLYFYCSRILRKWFKITLLSILALWPDFAPVLRNYLNINEKVGCWLLEEILAVYFHKLINALEQTGSKYNAVWCGTGRDRILLGEMLPLHVLEPLKHFRHSVCYVEKHFLALYRVNCLLWASCSRGRAALGWLGSLSCITVVSVKIPQQQFGHGHLYSCAELALNLCASLPLPVTLEELKLL